MYINLAEVKLNVQVQGEDAPLVMLHGLTSNISAMQPEIDRLSQSYQTIAIDSRGHGLSTKPAQYTLQNHIDDVLGVMEALKLEKIFLMGSSMGSYIAQGVAIQEPRRVAKLVLVTPKAHGRTSSVARLIGQHAQELAGKSPEEIQAFVLAKIFAPTTSPEVKTALASFGQQQLEAGLVLTPEQNLAANKALENFDFRPTLASINAKTLVISGRHDPLNPPEEGELLASLIPDATFVVLEHSGHLPAQEEPERLIALIEEFLRD